MRKLNLRLALATLRVLSKNVENNRGAIDDLCINHILEFTSLARGQFGICDYGVGTNLLHKKFQLLRFTFAEIGRHVWMRSALQEPVEYLGTCSLGQGGEFAKRVLGFLKSLLTPKANHNNFF